MSDLFTIGLRGVIAFQQAMAVTGQNMANIKTPFYSRREINFAEDMFNNGVSISDVRRIYDESASQYLQKSTSIFEMSNVFYQRAAELEALLGNDPREENKNTIGVFINDAIKALRELNGNTSSVQARTMYLNKLSALSSRFNAISNEITQRQTNNNITLNTTVNTVNQITNQIAAINAQITESKNLGQDISSLLDMREAQVQELAKYMDITTQTDESGNFKVLISNGTALVMGQTASQLSTAVDPANPDNLLLNLSSGASTISINNLITSGQIAGLYQTQNILQNAQISLGRLSLGLMSAFNAQNKLGTDYNGALGGNIFDDINSVSVVGQRAIANTNNTGSENVSVNIADVTALQLSDYKMVFDTPTHYTLTRLSDNSVVSSGAVTSLPQQISADGFTVNINSGTIVAGDQFTISPTRGAASGFSTTMMDPKLLALGWPVNATANVSNTGSGTINVDSILDTTNSAFSNPMALNPPIIIQFLSATTYQIVDANNNNVIEGPITYDPQTGGNVFPTPGNYDPGYRVSLSGSIQSGDTFNLDYNLNGMGDNRNGLEMEKLYQKGIFDGGSLTFSQGYNVFEGDISVRVNSAKLNYLSSKTVRDQADIQYKQISQVDATEESINLAMYQECFQACSQVLQIAKNVFDTIIGLGRN